MKKTFATRGAGILAAAIAGLVLLPGTAQAHCDGMDGPVVQAGRAALERGDAGLALVWVQPKDEPEIRNAFARTLAVRKLSPEARELADRYFFETLVRIHREGEGAPYTGLKPAGRDLGPAIPAADKAIAGSSVEPVLNLLKDSIQKGVRQRYMEVSHRRDFDPADLQSGRAYVKAYVEFLHYVEGVYAASAASHAHEAVGHQGEQPIHHHEP
ncbi:MAG: hypothetical protein IT167_14650 [Bryobacterales bacterium]|nr:hypothetical protein [Bryobacterales bacterium]